MRYVPTLRALLRLDEHVLPFARRDRAAAPSARRGDRGGRRGDGARLLNEHAEHAGGRSPASWPRPRRATLNSPILRTDRSDPRESVTGCQRLTICNLAGYGRCAGHDRVRQRGRRGDDDAGPVPCAAWRSWRRSSLLAAACAYEAGPDSGDGGTSTAPADPADITGTLRLFSYSDGFDPEYMETFFEKYPNIELETASFGSNEEAVAKIQAGLRGRRREQLRRRGHARDGEQGHVPAARHEPPRELGRHLARHEGASRRAGRRRDLHRAGRRRHGGHHVQRRRGHRRRRLVDRPVRPSVRGARLARGPLGHRARRRRARERHRRTRSR